MEAKADHRNREEPPWAGLYPRVRAQRLHEWFALLESALRKIDLPADCKEHASTLIQRLRRRKETAIFVEGLMASIALALLLISIVLGPIIVDFPVWREPGRADNLISWILNLGFYLTVLGTVYIVSSLPGLHSDDDDAMDLLDESPGTGTSKSGLAFAGSWTVISLSTIFVLAKELNRNATDRDLDSLATALIAATISVAAYFLLNLVITLPLGVWFGSKEKKWQANMADSLLVQNLLLAWNEANGEGKDLGQRVRIAAHLERAAETFEDGLARRFRPDDAVTKDWLKNELRRKAGAIRQLKQNVYFPTGGGQQSLPDKCQTLLTHILTGDWNALPSADIQPPKSLPLLERLRRLGQRLFNAFLPLLVLIALRGRVSIEPTTSTYLWTVAVAWAVLGILTITDPAIEGKVQALKDSTEAIRGLQSEKP